MSDFAAAATRLAGEAGAVLGWSPNAFWRSTPAELAAVVTAATGARGAAAEPPDGPTIAALREAFPDG